MLYALITSILIGVYAQKGKGRTGAFWGIAGFVFWWLLYFLTYLSASDIIDASDSGRIAGFLTPSFVTLVVFCLLIMTLPNKKKE